MIRWLDGKIAALPRIYFIMQLYFMLKGFYYMLYLGVAEYYSVFKFN